MSEGIRAGFRSAKSGLVFESRHTTGLANGAQCSFEPGEVVQYNSIFDGIVMVEILGEMIEITHAPGNIMSLLGDCTGYRCRFPDGSEGFAARNRIIGWNGKL